MHYAGVLVDIIGRTHGTLYVLNMPYHGTDHNFLPAPKQSLTTFQKVSKSVFAGVLMLLFYV